MSFNGTLIQVGSYEIPTDIIQADSYSVLWSTSDYDSYRDANGVLHRNALEHKVGKVEFNTKNGMTNTEIAELMSNISANYTNSVEKKATVTFYVPELDDYKTQDMYVPDITFQMYMIKDKTTIVYDATRIAFIGY